MNIILSNSKEVPIYEQIKSQLKQMIIDGKMKQDEPLPGMRTLAKDLRVSVITTKRAYNDLETEGFIYTVPGKGSFVAGLNLEYVKEVTLQKMEEHLQAAIDLGRRIHCTKEEMADMIDNLWE